MTRAMLMLLRLLAVAGLALLATGLPVQATTDPAEEETTDEGDDTEEPAGTDGPIVPTADFRFAPTIAEGSYTSTIVTGEVVWYAVLYANDVPFRFAVEFADPAVAEDPDLNLQVSFIGPTLNSLRTSPVVEGSASYDGGGTNRWYLAVSLDTEGRRGIEHEFVLDVEGVQEGTLDPCDEDCTLDDELAEIDSEIVDLQGSIGELGGQDAAEVIGAEIDALETRRDDATSTLSEADAEIAMLCDPEPSCDTIPEPAATTPTWALAAGGGLLGVGVLVLVFALVRGRRSAAV